MCHADTRLITRAVGGSTDGSSTRTRRTFWPRGGKRPSRRRQDGRKLRRYKRRWRVESLFAHLKRFRRIATRWDVKSANFLGLLQLACAVLLLRAMRAWL